MSDLAFLVEEIPDGEALLFGGKARSLGMMVREGLRVPRAVGVSSEAYDRYIDSTGLRGKILIELNRKSFEDMRWEEMWDAALRIRGLFSKTPINQELRADLEPILKTFDGPVVVRSSAVGEDSANASFAGIHESYVNVKGLESILEHLKLVWASLWSDRAMLYRKELGLDVESSTMAVAVQEMVFGERSGIIFGMSPNEPDQAVVEAVHGLNQGLVDGTVEPDRWILDRNTGWVLAHHPASREKAVVSAIEGVKLSILSKDRTETPPLADEEVARVYEAAMKAESIFGSPQDVEWTILGGELYVLQSRPITAAPSDDRNQERAWYISLQRSFDRLREMRFRIEDELIPAMAEEGARLEEIDLSILEDGNLAEEIEQRIEIYDEWHQIYWDEFIPFAHGVRLFGQVYNDTIHPSDPYEFVDLLGGEEMISIDRNRRLEEMASKLRDDPALARIAEERGEIPADHPLGYEVRDFISIFGGKYSHNPLTWKGLTKLLLEVASSPPRKGRSSKKQELKGRFLSKFQGEERSQMEKLLDLARVSYRLRDDDNIYLGKIESELEASRAEGIGRLASEDRYPGGEISDSELLAALKDPGRRPKATARKETQKSPSLNTARQLLGQPASRGVSTGRARVIKDEHDLFSFKHGEILVVDAVDPNMTFVVPLAAGIVERRGGMLIHGSIIAREYGIACVTGVPDATEVIKTGDMVTVDGFLGIVTVDHRSAKKNPGKMI